MVDRGRTPVDPALAAHARVVSVAEAMHVELPRLATELLDHLANDIAELRGDPLILDLLRGSIRSNLEEYVRTLRYDLSVDRISAPPAAIEYARRLAQRGTSASALLRAYRLGQARALTWALGRIDDEEPVRDVAVAATHVVIERSFTYVDRVAEQVVAEYESERLRWLANRTSVRAATVDEVLSGSPVDIETAEAAIGYRLRQHHLGAVMWSSAEGAAGDLAEFERLLGQVAKAAGGIATSLFLPRDKSSAWAWIPLGRSAVTTRDAAGGRIDFEGQLEAVFASAGVRLALGRVAAGVDGFRVTNDDARRAQNLALLTGVEGSAITSWSGPDMQAATMLAGDIESTRRLVAASLGALASDTESAARLRKTVRTFLDAQGSYAATAEALHLHKNSVKYRIAKAVEARGRPLDQGRLDLELALIACDRLGSLVLPGSARPY